MTNEEILRHYEKAKVYASKRGHAELADDFAQEVFIGITRGWHQTFEQAFIEFLRGEYGNTRTLSGSARALAKKRIISLDAPIGEDEGGTQFHDIIADPDSNSEPLDDDRRNSDDFRSFEEQLVDAYFPCQLKQKSYLDLMEEFGMTYEEVKGFIRPLKRQMYWQKVEKKIQEGIEAAKEIVKRESFEIDWIRL